MNTKKNSYTKRNRYTKTIEDKKLVFQKLEEKQKKQKLFLERVCFIILGSCWTAAGIMSAVYSLFFCALLSFIPAFCFWVMLFAGYTAPLSPYDIEPPVLTPEEKESLLALLDEMDS